jgi:hypothetical protein
LRACTITCPNVFIFSAHTPDNRLSTGTSLQSTAFAGAFSPTGPGPVFGDYSGLLRTFWEGHQLEEKRKKLLILQENQALSR